MPTPTDRSPLTGTLGRQLWRDAVGASVGCRLLFGSLIVLCCSLRAAAPPDGAQTRAALYQRETRTELHQRGWHIASDEPGKLVADRPGVLGGSAANFGPLVPQTSGPAMQAQLTISFQPRSATHTHCAASVFGVIFAKPPADNPKKLSTVYVDLDSPENTKGIQNIMAKAEGRLVAAHPEFGAR